MENKTADLYCKICDKECTKIFAFGSFKVCHHIKMKFKNEALEELKKNFEISELDTINNLLEGKTKCNSIKKVHLETFRKIICHFSKELDFIESDIITEETTKVRRVYFLSKTLVLSKSLTLFWIRLKP